jgi:tetratricopeptide (TPR) repeat protein
MFKNPKFSLQRLFHCLINKLKEINNSVEKWSHYLYQLINAEIYERLDKDDRSTNFLQGILCLVLAIIAVRFLWGHESNAEKFIEDIRFLLIYSKLLDIATVTAVVSALLIVLIFVWNFLKKLSGIRLFLFFLFGFLLIRFQSEAHRFLNNLFDAETGSGTSGDALTTIGSFTWLIQLIAAVLLGIVLYLLWRWLSSSGGILVSPFEVDKSLESQTDNSFNGQAIADSLIAQLHQIQHIHGLIEDGKETFKVQPTNSLLALCRENIDLHLGTVKGDNLEQALKDIGTISLGNGRSLSIGSLLISVRQLWPQGSVQVITGSVYQSNQQLHIAARLQQNNAHTKVHAYEMPPESEASQALPDLLQDLAYRITFDLVPQSLSTTSWEAFKFFTEALCSVIRYQRTQALDDLKEAYEQCIKANEKDKTYENVGRLLGIIGFSYLNRENYTGNDRYSHTRKVLETALQISPNSPNVLLPLGNLHYLLGDYQQALDYYERAKELDPKRYEVYIRIGVINAVFLWNYSAAYENFCKSIRLNYKNHAARSALAWLYFVHYYFADFCLETDGKCAIVPIWKNWSASQWLEAAYQELVNMPELEKTHIDHSNFAIVLLYKLWEGIKNKQNSLQKIQEATKNYQAFEDQWRKALYTCTDTTAIGDFTRKFYKFLSEPTAANYPLDHQDLLPPTFVWQTYWDSEIILQGLTKLLTRKETLAAVFDREYSDSLDKAGENLRINRYENLKQLMEDLTQKLRSLVQPAFWENAPDVQHSNHLDANLILIFRPR